MFSIGFDESRKRAKKVVRHIRSCFNCLYFYQAVGDEDEVCQNSNVSDYDLVIDDNNIYCTYWKLSDSKENTIFENGRNRKL